ncbi:hypothetical protein GCM10017600_10470 [Streptosporangium carneum]|uniref:Integrase catalytic domain-containing protein n=1 Tax=Streptosporangium carneum TaxID=47481 RepID=A0A9W6HX25_9ACTN|nr:hypothetical protein GCM10017600_10470 [Streptosporangium carneum]
MTNGTADNQLGKIRHTGLADAVDGYALSGVEGIRKPDTGLFEIVAQRCGTTLTEGGWMSATTPSPTSRWARQPGRERSGSTAAPGQVATTRHTTSSPMSSRRRRSCTRTTHSSEAGMTKAPADARADVFRFIEVYCNRKRLHSALGCRTPRKTRVGYSRGVTLAA